VGCPVGAVLLAWDPITCGVVFLLIVVACWLLVPTKDEDLSLLRGLCLLDYAELLHPASVAAGIGVFLCVLLCEMGIQIILNIVYQNKDRKLIKCYPPGCFGCVSLSVGPDIMPKLITYCTLHDNIFLS